ncbi:MAG: hypothetical protein ACI4TK_09860 [Agathobacter sp.]
MVAGDKIIFSVPQDWPSDFEIEEVPGSKQNALLLVSEQQGYIQGIFVCDLINSQVAEIIPEDILQYSVYEVDVSLDLKHMLFQTDDTALYYDGKTLVDLSSVCESSGEGRIVGLLLDDSVLLSVYTDRPNMVSFYVYDLSKKEASFVAEIETTGLKRYGDQYATEIRDGKLVIWNLLKGEYTETVIPEDKYKSILSVNENYFLVITTEDRLCLIDKGSAKVRYISDKKADFADANGYGIVMDEQGAYFLQVLKTDKVEYYSIQ